MNGGPRIAVVTFPGSNDDGDASLALELLGASRSVLARRRRRFPPGTEGVVLPGGFSYGDYLRCGAIARFAPVMEAVADFAARAGRYSGSATASRSSARRACSRRPASQPAAAIRLRGRHGHGREHGERRSPAAGPSEELVIPIKHGEGNWYGDADLARRTRGSRADRIPLHRGRQRRRRPHRGRHERGRQRPRADAAPRARRRRLLGPTGGVPVLAGSSPPPGPSRTSRPDERLWAAAR